jgi:protease-4
MRTLGKIIIGFFTTIGLIVVVFVALGIYGASRMRTAHVSAPEKFLLTVNFDKAFTEGPRPSSFASFDLSPRLSLQDALVALKAAKDDPRVVGLVATINDHTLGLAQTQEVRDLVAQFRANGKPAMEFSETIGEGEGALSTYYLASAFGDIWVQPSGSVGVAGIAIEQPFVRKLLDRIGITMDVVQRKEFKTAFENFTNAQISAPNKEEWQALLGSWYDQMVTGIAADRKLSPDEVKALIDKGPLLATEAKDGGLIDHLGYRDDFEAALKQKFGATAHLPLDRYMQVGPPPGQPQPAKSIAIVTASGEIARGGNEENPLSQKQGIKSDVIAKAIRDAAANKDIAAIVLRIDSPGGDYVASDTIWREIAKAKETKKPFIVSMGDTAASGGYFIAMNADRVFAEPATITGSIGVLTGKAVIAGVSQKLDVNWDRTALGQSADLYSSLTDFSPAELARLNQVMDTVYADFTTKAADGRHMQVADLEKVARGRVWSGADALKIGLVDEMGGLLEAVDYAKTRIGLKATDRVYLVPYPVPKSPWQELLESLRGGDMAADVETTVKAVSWFARTAAPAFEDMSGVDARGPQLRMVPAEAK